MEPSGKIWSNLLGSWEARLAARKQSRAASPRSKPEALCGPQREGHDEEGPREREPARGAAAEERTQAPRGPKSLHRRAERQPRRLLVRADHVRRMGEGRADHSGQRRSYRIAERAWLAVLAPTSSAPLCDAARDVVRHVEQADGEDELPRRDRQRTARRPRTLR